MSVEHLQVLRSIVEEGSFRAASQKLHKAQSAVSYSIKTLEQLHGFQIFSREKYRPELTAHGKVFYKKALKVLRSHEELEQFSQTLALNHEAKVSLSFSLLAELGPILQASKTFMQNFKQTELELKMEVLSGEKMVLNDIVDMAIVEELEQMDEFDSIRLSSVQMPIVISSDCSLIQDMNEESLFQIPQIIIRSTIEKSQDKGVIKDASFWYVNDMRTKKKMILEGVGWGSLPLHYVESELNKGTLTEIHFLKSERTNVNLYLIRKRKKIKGRGQEFLWENLIKACAELNEKREAQNQILQEEEKA